MKKSDEARVKIYHDLKRKEQEEKKALEEKLRSGEA